MANNSVKNKLLEHWLESERDKHKRLTENRRAIATKAQGNITIAGIFIAVSFAWLKDVAESKIPLHHSETVGIVIATTLFLLSILTCVFVLFIGSIPSPRDDTIIGIVLNKNEADLNNRLSPLLHDLCNHWNTVNEELECFNKNKSYMLFLAQVFLSIGIAVIALIAIFQVM